MATRSNIGIEYESGDIHLIYCHFDGYISGVGNKLLENYTDVKTVEKLIALGDISSLEADVYSTQSRSYHVKHGEDICIRHTTDREECVQQEFAYIFSVKENQWYVSACGTSDWIRLNENTAMF